MDELQLKSQKDGQLISPCLIVVDVFINNVSKVEENNAKTTKPRSFHIKSARVPNLTSAKRNSGRRSAF